jgi:hypothetical protein
VEGYAIGSLDLKALAKKAKLLVYVGPKLTAAVDFVTRQERQNALLDVYQFLSCIAVKHYQVIANMEKFAANLKDGIARVITDDKSPREAPCAFSYVISHMWVLPFCVFRL